ncbi:hypothetical protein CALCODRAFT_521340 [Calocera cornea HHB12733]|uniref:Uncharacterized protein n=1 Tax=Calocera cornea HHB12733 TaxID=1353952 RepID=A0A165CVG1_9BASI|nr:hypothetical protein CALCODRAFT_521340 [Calocera cornea HHB12733]
MNSAEKVILKAVLGIEPDLATSETIHKRLSSKLQHLYLEVEQRLEGVTNLSNELWLQVELVTFQEAIEHIAAGLNGMDQSFSLKSSLNAEKNFKALKDLARDFATQEERWSSIRTRIQLQESHQQVVVAQQSELRNMKMLVESLSGNMSEVKDALHQVHAQNVKLRRTVLVLVQGVFLA